MKVPRILPVFLLLFIFSKIDGIDLDPSDHEESFKLKDNTAEVFKKNDDIQMYKTLSSNIAFYNNAIGALNNKSKNIAVSKQEESYITLLKETLKTDNEDIDTLTSQAAERRKTNKSRLLKRFGQKTLDVLEKERNTYLQEIKKTLRCDDSGLQQFLDYAKVNEYLQTQSQSSIGTVFAVLSIFSVGGAGGYFASKYHLI